MGEHLDLPLPLFSLWVLADCQATVGVSPYCPFLLTLEPQTNPYSDLGLIGGQVTSLPSFPTVQLSLGPMARDVESLALCLKALLCEHLFTLDPTVPPLPFREEVSGDGDGQGEETLEPRWSGQVAAATAPLATRWHQCLNLEALRLFP